jgi:hypothetical protein
MKKTFLFLVGFLHFIGNSQTTIEADSVHNSYSEVYPIIKGCQEANDLKKCFEESIQKHYSKNFNAKNFTDSNIKPNIYNILVTFQVNNVGVIDSISVNAQFYQLSYEAVRVAKIIPRCIPGKIDETPVRYKFSLPIVVKVEETEFPPISSEIIHKRIN